MKKILMLTLALVLLLGLIATPVMAANGKSGPAGKSNVGHIYLVEKDPNTWAIIEDGIWGKLKYSLSGSTLDVVLNAHDLVPGNWYMIELVDWNSDWQLSDVISEDNLSRFYGQADPEGNVHVSFSWPISLESGAQIEINLKNADNVALLDPSAYGIPSEWIIGTGQGWNHVLYAAALIDVP